LLLFLPFGGFFFGARAEELVTEAEYNNTFLFNHMKKWSGIFSAVARGGTPPVFFPKK